MTQALFQQEAKANFLRKASNQTIRTNIDLYKDSTNTLRPTTYLRYEQLNHDYENLMRKLGQSNTQPLPHLKKTITTARATPQQLFSADEIKIVNNCFAGEFEYFGYNQF